MHTSDEVLERPSTLFHNIPTVSMTLPVYMEIGHSSRNTHVHKYLELQNIKDNILLCCLPLHKA